ncbi:unnamed protein product [Lampetra planeri]
MGLSQRRIYKLPKGVVTPQAIVLLSVSSGVLLLLILLVLFLDKRLCFSSVGGPPCLKDREPRAQKRLLSQAGGDGHSLVSTQADSSDSETEGAGASSTAAIGPGVSEEDKDLESEKPARPNAL